MKNKYNLIKDVASVVGDHPKKVIAAILIFTILMGISASSMDIGMDEEAFNPDTPRVRDLDYIGETFGTTDESVQMTFTASSGDVFTTDVMMDMLNIRMAFKENPQIKDTLQPSEQFPDGMNMLVDMVLTVDRVLELDSFVKGMPEDTSSMAGSMKNQTQVYHHMNNSLQACVYLLNVQDMHVMNNATLSFMAMAEIVSTPTHWMALEVYGSEFMELVFVLHQDDTLENKIAYTEHFLYQMSQADPVPGLNEFLSFTRGMNGIMKNSPEHSETAIGMYLEFMNMGMALVEMEPMEDLAYDIPSLALSDQEKVERINEMDDHELKDRVRGAFDYEPEELMEAIGKTMWNFENMEGTVTEALIVLDEMGRILEGLQGTDLDQGVSIYRRAVLENSTSLAYARHEFGNMRSMLVGAENLPVYLKAITNGIEMMVSQDFSKDTHEISASSTIAMVQLNSSMKREYRLESQQTMIRLGKEIPEHSTTRVFAGQVMMEEINESTNESMTTLLPIAFIFVVLVLLIIYRKVPETLLSLLSLVFAIIWTFGMGVILGYKFNPIIIAVPVLITGLVIDYGIHMVMRYREEKNRGDDPAHASHIAITTVGGALFLTTITTAIGFYSNTFSNIEAMKQFGILAAVGILSSFILMIVFLPASLVLLDGRRKNKQERSKVNLDLVEKQGKEIIGRVLSGPADAADKHPFVVLAVVGLITICALYGVFNIDTTFNIQDFLPEEKSQSQNIKYITANFNISTSYAYVITQGDLEDHSYLMALHDTKVNMEGDQYLLTEEGFVSPLTVIQEYGNAPFGAPNYNATIVNAYRESEPDEFGVPTTNVSGLMDVLYQAEESSHAIRRVLYRGEEGYQVGVLMVKENSQMMTRDIKNAAYMERNMKEAMGPLDDYNPRITSGSIVAHETTDELSATQIRSLIATIIIVAILLTIVFYYLYKSLILGIITTLPVAVITLWIVGTMYAMGVSLNVMTVSITALTVGMGVDYSIHVTHRFTEELKSMSSDRAMHETIQNTGAALVGSATTTIGAFAILTTSDILPMSQFGMITAMAIAYSFLVSIFVLPSALMIWERRGRI